MRRIYLGLITLILCCATYANEKSIYDFSWLDSDKEVYVLQNRKFRKASKVYIGGTIGKQTNGAFIDSYAVDLYAGYFFKEDWGVELSYTKGSGKENATHDAVNSDGSSVAFYRKMDTATTAMLMWSPFYSKINTFNKIFYFDWLLGAGFSNFTSLDNRNKFLPNGFAEQGELTSASNIGLSWMTGLRFHISESWSSRIDFKAFHIKGETASRGGSSFEIEEKYVHYYNVNFGINYTF